MDINNIGAIVYNKQEKYLIADAENSDKLIKRGIWLYFFLLLFEGALRKWVLPGLAAPLLVVRDPLAIWILFTAWKDNKLPVNSYVLWFLISGTISFFATLLVGHGSLWVAIYGFRILIFHWPLMFLIGRIFNRDDVIQMGKVVLWISLPMIVLIALQFYSPQGTFINRGVGGDTEAGFQGALGYFRPPGTFSFTSGNTQFWSLTGVFVYYFWLNPNTIKRYLLIASTVALISAIPLSISRGLSFQLILSFIFATVSVSRNPKYLSRMILAGLGLFFIILILDNVSFFQTATQALTSRFEDAGDAEGGLKGTLGDRFLGGLISAVTKTGQPILGYGMGMGTNAGARLLTGGTSSFLIAEEEWGRLVGEMGTILGLSIIIMRVHFCFRLLQLSYNRLMEYDLLPWMLLSWAIITVTQSQWAQPATLGFSTIIGGLTIAALNQGETDAKQSILQ